MGAAAAKKSLKKTRSTSTTKPARQRTALAGTGVTGTRGTFFLVDVGTTSKPKGVVLVTDPKHALYDERVHLPPDERLIASIQRFGMRKTCQARKEDGQLLIVDGRERVKAQREANERALQEGAEPGNAKIEIVSAMSEDTARGVVMTSNIHVPETPATLLPKIERYIAAGHTPQEAAVASGLSLGAVKDYMACLELGGKALGAVRAGALPVSAGAALAQLPKEKQEAELESMLTAGTATAVEAKRRLKEHRTGKEQPSRYATKRQIDDAWERLEPYATGRAPLPEGAEVDRKALKAYYCVLSWCRGAFCATLESVLDELPKVKETPAEDDEDADPAAEAEAGAASGTELVEAAEAGAAALNTEPAGALPGPVESLA